MKRIWAAALVAIAAVGAASHDPAWWQERGVVTPGGAPSDFHVVNQGQVKWMAMQAAEEFSQKLPGPENAALLALVDAFPEGHNYRPANMGMLKAAAQPFYERLIALGWAEDYPWAEGTPADYRLANQGQLKNLFSFDLDAIDLDGDGVPDWWTRLHGVTHTDADGNPISVLDAYQNWLAGHTNVPPDENQPVGDGSTNPPTGLAPVDVAVLPGSAASGVLGTWVREGGALRAATRRGRVDYTADLSRPDIYRVTFTLSQGRIERGVNQAYDLRFSVDGHFVERRRIRILDAETATVGFETPFLAGGPATAELFWDNPQNGLSLRVHEVRFQRWDGPDTNASGLQDWVENRLIARNTVDRAPFESPVSPVCVEGRGRFAPAIAITGAASVLPGPDDTWFADVSLPEDGSEREVIVALENAGRVLARRMRWRATNLLAEPVARRILRAGDALRLAAAPHGAASGSGTISVNGQSIGTCAPGEAIPFTFDEPGSYAISASFTGFDGQGAPLSASRSISVEVVSVEPETIAAQVNQLRPWYRPAGWPHQAQVAWDSRLDVQSGGEGHTLRTTLPEERYGLVRLGAQGPVLAPVTVKGFNLWVMRNTDLFYEEIYPDGSFRAESTMILSPVLEEIWIEQRCRGPVAYLDGSRVRVFHPADFDLLGEIVVGFVHSSARAHSVCHYTDAYQGEILIGRGY